MIWLNRSLVVLGIAVAVAGVVLYGGAPSPSSHYHDDPSAGDLNGFSELLMVVVGIGIALWGYTRNDPRRRP